MKKTMATALLLATAIASSLVNAEHVTGEVKRIYPTGNKVHFRLKNDTCLTGSQYYYFTMNELDDTGIYATKNWYSMLLASAMSGTPISVKVSSCPTSGNIEIDYIYQDY